jgi:copper homeostasis protein
MADRDRPPMTKVEICISSDKFDYIYPSVSAAYEGGAATVELCASMQFEGLTPMRDQIAEARRAFRGRQGLMVMVRPREGDFCYSAQEFALMHEQIVMAAEAGADGVVFGVLNERDLTVDISGLRALVKVSHSHQLKTTFHRAFDATPDVFRALHTLMDEGVDRVLTNGNPWGSSLSALHGLSTLQQVIKVAEGKIGVVIGGGVTLANVRTLLENLPNNFDNISVHTHSAALKNGLADVELVKVLVNNII